MKAIIIKNDGEYNEDVNSILRWIYVCQNIASNWLEIMGHAPPKSSKTKNNEIKILKENHDYCPWKMTTHNWFC